jgi:hypothetical protein
MDVTDSVGATALRVEEDQRLVSDLARLLPELDLGEDAHAEHGLCHLAGTGAP